MATEYRTIEYRLHESLVQIQEMLSVLGFDRNLLESVIACKNLIKNKQYNIAVMGEFKRGKSSLINALLGARILPADATPTTATVNRITYGPEPKAVVHFHDGESKEIRIDQLADYVTKTTADGEARALRIREATIYFPTVICQNHIDIIDTPGLNDDVRMTRITIDMIANADAVVVPIHARAPFSETEKKFVCQLLESDGINNIVFVVTFLDQLDEDDYIYEKFMDYIRRRIQTEVFAELEKRESSKDILRKAHLLLDDLQIRGISSSLALESFLSNSREKREKSRFEGFSNALICSATAKQLENAITKTIENIKDVVSQFDAQNQKRRADFETQARKTQHCEETIRQYCAASPAILDAVFSEDFDELQSKINGINASKNFIVEEFIKALSGIRQNTHPEIYSVLSDTALKTQGEMNRRFDALKEELLRVCRAELLRLKERETAELESAFEASGVPEAMGFDEVGASMSRFVEAILSNLSFSWSVSPIPRAADLTGCDVIDTVIQAADVSIQHHLDELNAMMLTIRKNWFDQFSGHTKSLLAAAAEAIVPQKEAYDLGYKAYLRNYQVFYQDAQEIVRQCEAMESEFERRDA